MLQLQSLFTAFTFVMTTMLVLTVTVNNDVQENYNNIVYNCIILITDGCTYIYFILIKKKKKRNRSTNASHLYCPLHPGFPHRPFLPLHLQDQMVPLDQHLPVHLSVQQVHRRQSLL